MKTWKLQPWAFRWWINDTDWRWDCHRPLKRVLADNPFSYTVVPTIGKCFTAGQLIAPSISRREDMVPPAMSPSTPPPDNAPPQALVLDAFAAQSTPMAQPLLFDHVLPPAVMIHALAAPSPHMPMHSCSPAPVSTKILYWLISFFIHEICRNNLGSVSLNRFGTV